MSKGIRVHRPAHHLPAELVKRGSDIDVLITVASDAGDNKRFGFESTIRMTQKLIKSKCTDYQPSEVDENRILCNSGEKDGNPSRGRRCFNCRVSQFTRNGMFTGEQTAVGQVPVSLVAQEPATLYDLIKSLEQA